VNPNLVPAWFANVEQSGYSSLVRRRYYCKDVVNGMRP